MEQAKTIGIIALVIGGAIGIWVFTRITNFAGQMHSWQPPFTDTEYEMITLGGAAIALVLIIVGLINLTKKHD